MVLDADSSSEGSHGGQEAKATAEVASASPAGLARPQEQELRPSILDPGATNVPIRDGRDTGVTGAESELRRVAKIPAF